MGVGRVVGGTGPTRRARLRLCWRQEEESPAAPGSAHQPPTGATGNVGNGDGGRPSRGWRRQQDNNNKKGTGKKDKKRSVPGSLGVPGNVIFH